MTPEELKRIFQPFEQAGSRQQQAEGTGLGLAICHSIVQLMGGQIEVASEVGAGSTFWFEVPLPPVDDWSQSLQTDRVGQIVGIRDRQPCVLVVDDKWENRSVLVHLLSPIGFEVREAADGQAGLRLAIAQQPDVIIADISMPGMDGLEMIRRIRQSEALAQTPILVSSASVFESDRYQSLEAGANDFFSKPINASELLQKLQHHLNLVWIYAETASDLNDASSQPQRQTDVILPPSEAIDELYTLTMKGNMKGIIRYLEDLVITQPHLTPFAAKITQLAEAFDDEAILHCLDRA
jgi:CheY-like chemotaxis protein